MKHFLILIVAIVAVCGCSDSEASLDRLFEERTIAMVGRLEAGASARIIVTRTITDVHTPKADLIIRDAIVRLTDMDQVIDELDFVEGEDRYVGDYVLEPERFYGVEVEVLGCPGVSADSIYIPHFVGVLDTALLSYKNDNDKCNGDGNVLVSLKARLGDIGVADRVRVESLPYAVIGSDTIYFCEERVQTSSFCEEFISRKCVGIEGTVTKEYEVPRGWRTDTPGTIEFDIVIANYSHEYERYQIGSSTVAAVEDGFLEPPNSFTNVKNGIGVVYGVSRAEPIHIRVPIE